MSPADSGQHQSFDRQTDGQTIEKMISVCMPSYKGDTKIDAMGKSGQYVKSKAVTLVVLKLIGILWPYTLPKKLTKISLVQNVAPEM